MLTIMPDFPLAQVNHSDEIPKIFIQAFSVFAVTLLVS